MRSMIALSDGRFCQTPVLSGYRHLALNDSTSIWVQPLIEWKTSGLPCVTARRGRSSGHSTLGYKVELPASYGIIYHLPSSMTPAPSPTVKAHMCANTLASLGKVLTGKTTVDLYRVDKR